MSAFILVVLIKPKMFANSEVSGCAYVFMTFIWSLTEKGQGCDHILLQAACRPLGGGKGQSHIPCGVLNVHKPNTMRIGQFHRFLCKLLMLSKGLL